MKLSSASRGVPTFDSEDVLEERTGRDSPAEAMPCGTEPRTPGALWLPCCNYESRAWLQASAKQLGAAGKAALVAESCRRADGPTESCRRWEADLEPKEDHISALCTAWRSCQCQPHSSQEYAGICHQYQD